MRISDWSSDVCSSDLIDPARIQLVLSNVDKNLFFKFVLGVCSLVHGLDFIQGHAQQAVFVSQNQAAGLDDHAVQADGDIDFARTVIVWTPVWHPACVNGKRRSEGHKSEHQ